MALDNDYFINQVKLKGAIPDGRFKDQELLDVAWDRLKDSIVPFIIGLYEEFYVVTADQTITQAQSNYPIPYRAMGLSIISIKRIQGNRVWDIDRISPNDVKTTTQGMSLLFYPEGQDIVLYPTPSATGDTLRLRYVRTPNQPALVADCAKITNIDTITGVITAVSPAGWSTSNAFDLISQRNGHKVLTSDLVASNVVTTSLTFTATDIPTDLIAGDYIALAGYTPFIQVPDICLNLAIRETVLDLLDSMGDQGGVERTKEEIGNMRQAIMKVMGQRIQGEPRKSRISLI